MVQRIKLQVRLLRNVFTLYSHIRLRICFFSFLLSSNIGRGEETTGFYFENFSFCRYPHPYEIYSAASNGAAFIEMMGEDLPPLNTLNFVQF